MIENVPEIPCLYDRRSQCLEMFCPLQQKNEKNILNIFWELRRNNSKYGITRWAFEKKGIDITPEMICDLLLDPEGLAKSDGSRAYGVHFNNIQKQFGEYIASKRKSWIDKHDNHWDPYHVRCLVKKARLLAHGS